MNQEGQQQHLTIDSAVLSREAFLKWVEEDLSIPNSGALLCPTCGEIPDIATNLHDPRSTDWKIELRCEKHPRYKEVNWFACKYCPSWAHRPKFVSKRKGRDLKKVNRFLSEHDHLHRHSEDFMMDIDEPHAADNDACIQIDNHAWVWSLRTLYDCKSEQHKSVKYVMEKCGLVISMDDAASMNDIVTFLRMAREFLIMSRAKQERFASIFHGIVSKLTRERDERLGQATDEVNELKRCLQQEQSRSAMYHAQLEQYGITPVCSIPHQEYYSLFRGDVGKDRLNEISSISFPTCFNDVRRILEGKKSLVANLLTPEVHIEAGCAIVLPSEALQLQADLGMEFEREIDLHERNNLSMRSHHRSPNVMAAASKCPPHVNFVPLGYWSDGAEMSNSKSNRSSGKIATVFTLQHPLPKMNIFLVALGRSNLGTFSLAQSRIMNDLAELSRGPIKCLEPGMGGIELVQFGLTTVIQDRPEHDEFTGCVGHGGTFSKVPGYSCPIQVVKPSNSGEAKVTVLKDLMSCPTCEKRRMDFLAVGNIRDAAKSSMGCHECYDWDLLQIRFKFTNPKDHPIHGVGVQSSKMVTFESMRNAMELICDNVFNGTWVHKYESRKFAKVECIRQMHADAIHMFAKGARDSGQHTSPPRIPKEILPVAMQFDNLKLEQCLVGIMHTLVLNGGKSILLTLKDFFTKVGKWSEFYKVVNEILGDVRALSLSWVKAWTFGSPAKPQGPWVSETCLAFARISKAIISCAVGLLDDEADKVLVQKTIYCWNSLVPLILQPIQVTEELCMNVVAHVKVFLSHFTHLEVKAFGKPKRIESAPSIISLLKVADDMKCHGTLRNLWEGSIFGEGMFRVVKSLVSRGLYCPGTAKSVLKKYYDMRELDCLIDEIVINVTHDDDEGAGDSLIDDEGGSNSVSRVNELEAIRYRKFHSYKSMDVIRHDINNKKPVATLFCPRREDFFVLIRTGRSNRTVHKVNFESMVIVNGISCAYVATVMDESTGLGEVKEYISCLLLPMFKGNDVLFYIINEDHKEFNFEERKFVQPKVYV